MNEAPCPAVWQVDGCMCHCTVQGGAGLVVEVFDLVDLKLSVCAAVPGSETVTKVD